MAAGWIYRVDGSGVLVTPEFMKRLRNGDGGALRSINRQNLTALYRRSFTRLDRRPDERGLFWSDVPPLVLIPLVRAGRHPARAWTKDGLAIAVEGHTERRQRGLASTVRAFRKGLPPDKTILAKFEGNTMTAWYMKANPKFELVVINKHDRGTLLKLLSELDTASSVDEWLTERTEPKGATLSKTLYGDYAVWCEQHRQTAVGIKTFAQGLVAAGVVKLTRSNSGERYKLELRS